MRRTTTIAATAAITLLSAMLAQGTASATTGAPGKQATHSTVTSKDTSKDSSKDTATSVKTPTAGGAAGQQQPAAPATPELRPAAGQFVPLADEQVFGGSLAAGRTTTFAVSGRAGIPAAPKVLAVALSIEAVHPTGSGSLQVFDPAASTASTQKSGQGVVFAAGATAQGYEVVTPSADGRIGVYVSAATGVSIQVRGYYTATSTGPAGGTYVPLPAASLVDGVKLTAGPGAGVAVPFTQRDGLPRAAQILAVAVGIEASGAKSAGCVSARATGAPVSAKVNATATGTALCYRPGSSATTGFDTVVPSRTGQVTFSASSAVRLTVSVRGYYASPTSGVAGATYVPLSTAAEIAAPATWTQGLPAATVAGRYGIGSAGDTVAIAGDTSSGDFAVAPLSGAGPAGRAGRPAASAASAGSPQGVGPATVRLRGYFRKATAPHAPTAVKATAGADGTATVTWSPPSNDSGAAVSGYTVTVSPGGSTVRTAGPTQALVTGLTSGRRYTFSVTAQNAAGTSVASARSNAIVPPSAIVSGPRAKTATPNAASPSASSTANAAATTGPSTTITIDGAAASLTTSAAGQSAMYTFTGTAGQRVFTTITSVSVADYAMATLTSPAGATLASASYIDFVSDEVANIDVATLPTTGTYTVAVTPNSGLGDYLVQVASVPADVTASAAIGGAAATLTFAKAGQNGTVTFSGTAGTRLFTRFAIQSQTDPNQCFDAVLDDASGSELSGSGCAYSGGGYIDLVTLPSTGTYTVVVDPQGDETGSVAVTLAQSPADTTVSATFGGPTASATVGYGQGVNFDFTANAGQTMLADTAIGGAAMSTYATLLNSSGSILIYGSDGSIKYKFTATGTYDLYVSPTGAQTGTATATLYNVPADASSTATAGGAAVTTTTTAPGQDGTLSFTATAGQEIFVTCSVTSSDPSGITWFGLLDPSGNALQSNDCYSSPLFYRTTLSTAGTYKITWDFPGAATGSATLRIYSVPADVTATATVGGSAVSLTTTAPGQNAGISFTATAGQSVYLSCTQNLTGNTTGADLDASMYNPSGTDVSDSFCADPIYTVPVTTVAGTYHVEVATPLPAYGPMTVKVVLLPPPPTATATVGGAAASVSTTAAGQWASISFTATAGQRIYIACVQDIPGVTDVGRTDYWIVGPSGSQVGYDEYCYNVPLLFDTQAFAVAGTYTIEIAPLATQSGTATLRLYNVPADVTVAATVGGAAVTLATTAPGQKATLTFNNATAGQQVYITCKESWTNVSSYTMYELYDPIGNYAGDQSIGDCENPPFMFDMRTPPTLFDTQPLNSTGNYSITINPQGLAYGSVVIRVYSVPAPVTATLVPGGAAATLKTTSIGQKVSATFTAAAGQRVFITCSQTVGNTAGVSPYYSLLNPSGNLVENYGFCQSPPVLFDTQALATAGTYTIAVNPRGLATGSFTLRVYSPPADAAATATIGGAAVTATTTAVGQKAVVSFAGTANQRLFVSCAQTLSGGGGANPGYDLVNPSGALTTVGDCSSAPVLFDTQTLAATGTYKITVDPPGIATGAFTLRLYSPPADVAAVATVGGSAATVSTTVPGQKASVAFTATANERVFVSCAQNLANTGDGYTNFVLLDPSSNQVTFAVCDTPPLLFDSQVLSAAGTYTITVSPPGIATGSVSIRVYQVPDDAVATATVGAAATTVTTTAVGQKASVAFTGAAGQRLYASCAQTLANNAGANPFYLLFDPSGNLIAYGDCSGPPTLFDTLSLPAAGTYTISVLPPGIATGAFTVQLYSPPADVAATATVGGGATTVTTTAAGQHAVISFTGTAARTVTAVAAGSTYSGPVNVQLSAPDGTVLWSASVSSGGDSETATLPSAGTYTITISPGTLTGSVTYTLS